MPDYSEYIASALVSNGVSATARQINQLSDYLSELLRVNEYMNLTAIREAFEAAVKNIADCAVCTKYIPDNTSLLDVGSGAGLPAFPFAIMRPDIRVTALDSTGKKVNFISETVKKTGLDNLTAICGRAEELAANSQYREKFGAVSARAVARLNILSELCLPFIKKGGAFLAMKSRLAETELSEAHHAVSVLGGNVKSVEHFFLVGLSEEIERTVILVEKISPTPKQYPRTYARISGKPL